MCTVFDSSLQTLMQQLGEVENIVALRPKKSLAPACPHNSGAPMSPHTNAISRAHGTAANPTPASARSRRTPERVLVASKLAYSYPGPPVPRYLYMFKIPHDPVCYLTLCSFPDKQKARFSFRSLLKKHFIRSDCPFEVFSRGRRRERSNF